MNKSKYRVWSSTNGKLRYYYVDNIENAILIINSKKQIICEKLKSLLRFGIRTTRYKDIFDIYYLINSTTIN